MKIIDYSDESKGKTLVKELMNRVRQLRSDLNNLGREIEYRSITLDCNICGNKEHATGNYILLDGIALEAHVQCGYCAENYRRIVNTKQGNKEAVKPPIKGKCKKCGEAKPPEELFIYVDGNNRSITKNSPTLCLGCYVSTYGNK